MGDRFQRYGEKPLNYEYGHSSGFSSNRFHSSSSPWEPSSDCQSDTRPSQYDYNSGYNKKESFYDRRDYDNPHYDKKESYYSSSARRFGHETKSDSAFLDKYGQAKNYSPSDSEGYRTKTQFHHSDNFEDHRADRNFSTQPYSHSSRTYSEMDSHRNARYGQSDFEDSRASRWNKNNSIDYRSTDSNFNNPSLYSRNDRSITNTYERNFGSNSYDRSYPVYSRRDNGNREQSRGEINNYAIRWNDEVAFRRREPASQAPPNTCQMPTPSKIQPNIPANKFKGFIGNKKPRPVKKMKFKKGWKKFQKTKKGGRDKSPQTSNNEKSENNKREREDEDDDDVGDGEGLRSKEDVDQMKKKVKFEKVTTREEQINHMKARTTPLWEMPYPQQIRLKYDDGKKLVLKICENMSNANPHVKEFLEKQKQINDGLPCKIHDIIYKEKDYDFYKSRVELLVGLDSLTKKPCVGFRCGIGGVAAISDDILSIPKIILPHIHNFEKFLGTSKMGIGSAPDCYCVWRHLSFKVGMETNQVMMMVGLYVNNLKDPRILKAKNELRDYFKTEEAKGVTSLYLQIIKERSKNGPSFHAKHVHGAEYIEEIVEGVKFKLRPKSDFPNCRWGAEMICQSVRKLGNVSAKTVLIDIGSPLATVSLCLAKDCEQTYFIEPRFIHVASSIAANQLQGIAGDNNITNWAQSHSKVEKVFDSVIKKLKISTESDTLVYFDPWCGLRESGVNVIRDCTGVNRLLFLTCGKKLMVNNFTYLVKNNPQYPAEDTFVPVEAVPIDTYPHTAFMAVFILLERLKIAKNRSAGQNESPLSDDVVKSSDGSNSKTENDNRVISEKEEGGEEGELPEEGEPNSGADVKSERNTAPTQLSPQKQA